MEDPRIQRIKKARYNKIPVYYCSSCNSLKILRSEGNTYSYCGICGKKDHIIKTTMEYLIEKGVCKVE